MPIRYSDAGNSLSPDAVLDVLDLENDSINEGMDVEYRYGKAFVSFNDTHERGVDTSLEHNPTIIKFDVYADNIDIKTVDVYSIFKRVSGSPGDGNGLIFALKDEKNFMFKHGEKEKFRNRAKEIIAVFLDMYMKKIGNEFSTIVLPSGKSVNSNFAKLVKEIADKKFHGKTRLYDDIFMKLPVDLIRNFVQYDAGSRYNIWLHSQKEDTIVQISSQFDHDLDEMTSKRNGYFTYHMVSNPDIRNMISSSLSVCDSPTYSSAFSPINDRHVLMIDDLISRGNTIKDAIRNLCSSYHPKSVTVLTLLSQKF